MEQHLTMAEAWADFYKWMKDKKGKGDFARMPSDIQEANYAFLGKRKSKLGDTRIERLLTKYAPDRYEFRSVVIVHEK